MTRRMSVIVLVLVGLMVLVVTIAPPERGVRNGSAATVTPEEASMAPLSDPDAFDVSAKLSAAPGAAQKTIDAEVGDRVQIIVEGTGVDTVALGDLDETTVEADSPARFELLADTPGRYPLVLLDEGRRIGTLEIR
jgi:hypothetical protein